MCVCVCVCVCVCRQRGLGRSLLEKCHDIVATQWSQVAAGLIKNNFYQRCFNDVFAFLLGLIKMQEIVEASLIKMA